MNTSFQISKYLPQWQPGRQAGPQAGLPVSMNISVSGPQGPVWPAGPHQLSLRGRKWMRSPGCPTDLQTPAASSSGGTSSSPANTVTEQHVGGEAQPLRRGEELVADQAMASFLK